MSLKILMYFRSLQKRDKAYAPVHIHKQKQKLKKNKKKNFMAPLLCIGLNCLKATATSWRQFTFYHSVPRYFWYSFYRPRKDEWLSRPWRYPRV